MLKTKKWWKKLAAVLVAALLLAGICAMSACGTEGGGNEPGVETFVYEAEYVDLTDLTSDSYSGSIGETELVYGDGTQAQKDGGWSNGYYIGATYAVDFTLSFVFESDSEQTAAIILRLGSEIGTIALNSSNFTLKLNGNEINYGTVSVAGSRDLASMSFADKTFTTSAPLVKGQNTLSLIVRDNTLREGTKVGGPLVDCVKIKTKAALTWNNIDNPANKGQA